MDDTFDDIVTILSLCNAPGQASVLKRNHQNRVGSMVATLFKSAEELAFQIKRPTLQVTSSEIEYILLSAKPGSTFNKEFMQRQQNLLVWRGVSKKGASVLCMKEVGIGLRYRLRPTQSSGSGLPTSPFSKEIEVLTKAIVVFESDLDK